MTRSLLALTAGAGLLAGLGCAGAADLRAGEKVRRPDMRELSEGDAYPAYETRVIGNAGRPTQVTYVIRPQPEPPVVQEPVLRLRY